MLLKVQKAYTMCIRCEAYRHMLFVNWWSATTDTRIYSVIAAEGKFYLHSKTERSTSSRFKIVVPWYCIRNPCSDFRISTSTWRVNRPNFGIRKIGYKTLKLANGAYPVRENLGISRMCLKIKWFCFEDST